MVDAGAGGLARSGSPAACARELGALVARHRPDELILTGQIHDHAARLRSFEIAAEAMTSLATARPAAAHHNRR